MITRARVKLRKGDDHEVIFNHDAKLPEELVRRALAHSILAVEENFDSKYLSSGGKDKLVGLTLSYLIANRAEWCSAGEDKAGEAPLVAKILADLYE